MGKRLHCSEPRLFSGLKIGLRITHTRLSYKLFILFLQRLLNHFTLIDPIFTNILLRAMEEPLITDPVVRGHRFPPRTGTERSSVDVRGLNGGR